jgi:hypothetical protein
MCAQNFTVPERSDPSGMFDNLADLSPAYCAETSHDSTRTASVPHERFTHLRFARSDRS